MSYTKQFNLISFSCAEVPDRSSDHFGTSKPVARRSWIPYILIPLSWISVSLSGAASFRFIFLHFHSDAKILVLCLQLGASARKRERWHWVVCSTPHALSPHALSPDTLSPDTLSPHALSPNGLINTCKNQALQVYFLCGIYPKKYF